MADARIKSNKSASMKKKVKQTRKKNGTNPGPQAQYTKMRIGEKLDMIRGWVANNMTHTEIAAQLEISKATLSQWKGKYPEFKKAMSGSRKQAVGHAVASAYDQAVGYEREEKVLIKVRGEWYEEIAGKAVKCVQERVEEHTVMKYYPPNPKMTEFILVNWDPENFKRVNEVSAATARKLEDFFDELDGDEENDIGTTSKEKNIPVEQITQ